MLASGEQVSDKTLIEGDVVLESDGYIRLYLKNASGVWFDYVISPRSNHSWVSDPKVKPYVASGNRFVTNIKNLLVDLREEMRETST